MARRKIKNSDINRVAKLFRLNKSPIKSIVAVLTLGFGLGVAWEETVGIGTWHNYHKVPDKLNICFTPPSGCGSLIAIEISKAKSSIYVQAYGLTARPIINQLISAHKRGVKVKVLIDGGNLSDNNAIGVELAAAGIKTASDRLSGGIAHNKVIIIDNQKVITGSFNFTNAADTKNAENVLLLDDANIAKIYLQNWKSRADTSTSI